MSANLIEFQPLQFYDSSNSPTRTNRSNSKSPSKSPSKRFKGRFQVISAERIFRQTQVRLTNRSAISDDPLLSEYKQELQGIIENFDNKLLRTLHKQEANFLMAYKGVMRDVAQDLKYYQKELEKNTDEYKESENAHLKHEMKILNEEINKVLAAMKTFEDDNKKLRAIAVTLKEDLKNQHDILLKSEMEKKALQELCLRLTESLQQYEKEPKNLGSTSKDFHLRPFSAMMRQQTDRSSNLSPNSPVRHFLETDNTSRDKFEVRFSLVDKDLKSSNEKSVPSGNKRAKSPNEMQAQPDSTLKQEFKHLAELVSDILKEKFSTEDEIKPLTDKIVNVALIFVRQKTKEAKVLKETVERLQKVMSQKEKLEQEPSNDPDGSRRYETRILKEIFRECVEECTKNLIVNQHTLATSRNYLDEDKQKELQQRVEIFQRYLSHPQVVYFLENIIADRPLNYHQQPNGAAARLKSHSVSQMNCKFNNQKSGKAVETVNSQNHRAHEVLKTERKSVNDISGAWEKKHGYYFGQPMVKGRGARVEDSASDLLSDKDNQVGTPMHVQTPTTATQDSRAIIGLSNGSLIHGRQTRSNSSGGIRPKLSKGRLSKQPKQQNASYANIDDSQLNPPETFRATPDNSAILSKSPLSRRVQMTNGRVTST